MHPPDAARSSGAVGCLRDGHANEGTVDIDTERQDSADSFCGGLLLLHGRGMQAARHRILCVTVPHIGLMVRKSMHPPSSLVAEWLCWVTSHTVGVSAHRLTVSVHTVTCTLT